MYLFLFYKWKLFISLPYKYIRVWKLFLIKEKTEHKVSIIIFLRWKTVGPKCWKINWEWCVCGCLLNAITSVNELRLSGKCNFYSVKFCGGGGLNILIGLIILVLFVKIIDREKIISSNWFSPINRVKDFSIGGLLGSICIFLGFLIIINLNWSQVETGYFRLDYLLGSFFYFLCAAFLEELFFRGYVLRKLLERFSLIISLSFCSLIFCLLHCFNDNVTFLSIINIFLTGLLLGILFVKTKNIWLVTGFHFLWNYVQAILGFNVSGGEYPSILYLNFENMNLFNGGDFGFEGSYVCTIIILLALCFYSLLSGYKSNSFNRLSPTVNVDL